MNALILGMIRNLSGIWVVGRKSRGILDLSLYKKMVLFIVDCHPPTIDRKFLVLDIVVVRSRRS